MKKRIIAALSPIFLGLAVLFVPVATAAPAQAAYYTDCFYAVDGQLWCYRYGCSWQEQLYDDCYNGWVVVNDYAQWT